MNGGGTPAVIMVIIGLLLISWALSQLGLLPPSIFGGAGGSDIQNTDSGGNPAP